MSRWCRPMLGSSRIYSTPVRDEPICVASRIRCASPPESVPAGRERVRYSSPTSFKNPRRLFSSLRIRRAMAFSRSVSFRCSRKSSAPEMDLPQKSAMLMPPTVTARLVGDRRFPWHASHGMARM